MSNRPADIKLPEGWTWDRVESQRAKWGLAENLIPVACAAGAVAWGTIASERKSWVESQTRAALDAIDANQRQAAMRSHEIFVD